MESVIFTKISIHALREESDAISSAYSMPTLYFNPRPPRGERPAIPKWSGGIPVFQSTPSARRATGEGAVLGGDLIISIHALREESDPPRPASPDLSTRFQSTPSARRATFLRLSRGLSGGNFNPRPPRGERLARDHKTHIALIISIHALREESDHRRPCSQALLHDFNPRPPRGERPIVFPPLSQTGGISIHALREESDRAPAFDDHQRRHFNPRPPRGERPWNKPSWTA